jgi:hypothetical protein
MFSKSGCGKQHDVLIENLNGGYFCLFPRFGMAISRYVTIENIILETFKRIFAF